MGFEHIKLKANDLFSEAGYISEIQGDTDYQQALKLMENSSKTMTSSAP
ncbi:MAG: hypothetical protein V3V19_02890 [Cocleimonas sp.]